MISLLSRAAVGAAMALSCAPVFAKDVDGALDHPLVGRYQGSQAILFSKSDFDRVDLLNGPLPKSVPNAIPDGARLRVEGKSWRVVYEGPSDRSAHEIDANFAASLKAKGFQTVYACFDRDCVSGDAGFYQLGGLLDSPVRNGAYSRQLAYRLEKLTRPQGDVYVSIVTGKGAREPVSAIRVVEVKGMEDDKIVVLSASQMKAGLDAAGRVALYGVYFDTDKDVPKPESAPTLAEIAKLMRADPSLKLIVAGHTDDQGAFDYNVGLSQRRARAVAQALTKLHQIEPTRLTPFGVGMAAPVAVNADDAGRAKNRRVELVKR